MPDRFSADPTASQISQPRSPQRLQRREYGGVIILGGFILDALILVIIILPGIALAQSPESASDIAAIHGELFARDTFKLDTVVCPFKGKIDYEPGDIECYLLQVPENREKPDSRFIELHVVKLASTWDDEEVEEPEVRKEKEAPAPKAKSALANVVADWDTDD